MNKKESTDKPEEILNETDNITENETNVQSETQEETNEETETDKLAKELASLKDSHLRLMAEYDNYRKRTLKEKADLIKNGGEKVLSGLLPVMDDFERALSVEVSDEVSQAIVEGVKLIYGKMAAFLNQNGVKVIETEEMDFDSELFDAIATIPAPCKELKGKVVDCVQKGYTLNEKVIRHAKVVVGE